jgi:hypothetical protein
MKPLFATLLVVGLVSLGLGAGLHYETQVMTGIALGCIPTGALGIVLSMLITRVAARRPELAGRADRLHQPARLVVHHAHIVRLFRPLHPALAHPVAPGCQPHDIRQRDADLYERHLPGRDCCLQPHVLTGHDWEPFGASIEPGWWFSATTQAAPSPHVTVFRELADWLVTCSSCCQF